MIGGVLIFQMNTKKNF